jgi:hypothetical protein
VLLQLVVLVLANKNKLAATDATRMLQSLCYGKGLTRVYGIAELKMLLL